VLKVSHDGQRTTKLVPHHDLESVSLTRHASSLSVALNACNASIRQYRTRGRALRPAPSNVSRQGLSARTRKNYVRRQPSQGRFITSVGTALSETKFG